MPRHGGHAARVPHAAGHREHHQLRPLRREREHRSGWAEDWYTKARFDPTTLALTLNDTTFATSEGWALYGSTYIYSQALGNAADCVAPNSQTGRSNIDLTGTPFDIVPNQFRLDGYEPTGSATPNGSQVVHLTGGGYCGSIGTADGLLRLDLRSASEPTPELVHRYSFTTSGVDSVSGADASLEGAPRLPMARWS
ncbi:GON domain-containing protein [Cystobacter fuscus]